MLQNEPLVTKFLFNFIQPRTSCLNLKFGQGGHLAREVATMPNSQAISQKVGLCLDLLAHGGVRIRRRRQEVHDLQKSPHAVGGLQWLSLTTSIFSAAPMIGIRQCERTVNSCNNLSDNFDCPHKATFYKNYVANVKGPFSAASVHTVRV